jgi:hypothetical protein
MSFLRRDRQLSQVDDTVEPGIPDACPKCGRPTRAAAIARHFTLTHQDAIGTATFSRDVDFTRTFVYIGPVHGVVGRQWYIVWLDWPLQVVRIAPADWLIVWAGTDPAEGD